MGGGFEEGSPFPPQRCLFCVSRLCRLPGPSASVVSRPLRQNFSVTKTCWPVASAWRRSSSAHASALAPSLRAAGSPVRCLPALRHSNDSPPVLHSSHVCRVCLPVTALFPVLLSAAFPSQPQRTFACTPAYSFAFRHVPSSSHRSHAHRCHPLARCCCPRASGGLPSAFADCTALARPSRSLRVPVLLPHPGSALSACAPRMSCRLRASRPSRSAHLVAHILACGLHQAPLPCPPCHLAI